MDITKREVFGFGSVIFIVIVIAVLLTVHAIRKRSSAASLPPSTLVLVYDPSPGFQPVSQYATLPWSTMVHMYSTYAGQSVSGQGVARTAAAKEVILAAQTQSPPVETQSTPAWVQGGTVESLTHGRMAPIAEATSSVETSTQYAAGWIVVNDTRLHDIKATLAKLSLHPLALWPLKTHLPMYRGSNAG